MYYDASGQTEACNCAILLYCDGASFSGYRKDVFTVPPAMVPTSGPAAGIDKLWFRGIKNIDRAVEFLLGKGLDQATELVVTGTSAGGLSTFLHTDRIASRVPPTAKVRAAPVIGYFLDRPQYAGTTTNHPVLPPPVDLDHAYGAEMKYLMALQNVTAGALSPACLAHFGDAEAHKCFMAPHMYPFIKTPLFVFNSKFDGWQMGNVLQVGCLCMQNASGPINSCKYPRDVCDVHQKAAIAAYGTEFLDDFATVEANPDNGAFISSCICHACDWSVSDWPS
jgi:hypothetical protein